MAISQDHHLHGGHLPRQPKIHRYPQPHYSDSVRWLPSPSPFHKSFLLSSFNPNTHSSSLLTYTLDPSSSSPPDPTASWAPPSRVSSLASAPSLFAAATVSGSVHLFPSVSPSPAGMLEPAAEVVGAHAGRVGGVDLGDGVGGECCVSVGEEDGKVNLVGVEEEGKWRTVFDGNGLVSYTAVRWASGNEFVTGGVGVGLQWWDLRRPVPAVAQLKGIWDKGTTSGIIHSIDIHPSRKHTCLAGGSLGTVLAWDLRWQQQPVILSGGGGGNTVTHSLSQSEVWEVQFDCYTKSSSNNISSSRILPAMICSEDGILAVIEQGEEPTDLLAEPCAINSFDIDRHNPLDVICCLEWESIAIVARP